MNWWKLLLLGLGLTCLLWFLSPHRAITPDEPGIVEISFTGDPGANKAALDEAFLAFEAESQALHAKDPGHPSIALSPARAPLAIRPQTQPVSLSAWPAESRLTSSCSIVMR
ncbi:MAG: hypothetical protein ABIO87_07160 [Chthoniobacterales bacterium]